MKKCLVTGCLGFTGKYLMEFLQKKDRLQLFGMDVKRAPAHKIQWNYSCVDLSNRNAVIREIRDIRPDCIFHLAGSMFCTSYEEYHRNNIKGTINLLNALLAMRGKKRYDPVIIDIGSSAEYGFVDRKNIPVTEKAPLNPVNHYGISKVVQGLVALRYHSVEGLKVIHTRTFNLIGPGQSSDFVCGSITRQIVALERSKTKKRLLNVGNVKSIRDFVDVRDAVKAYWMLSQKGKPGNVYNVCSGKGTSIMQVIRFAGRLTDIAFELEKSKQLYKTVEVPIQIGKNSRLRSLGWRPEIAVEESLEDMLKWLRVRAPDE